MKPEQFNKIVKQEINKCKQSETDIQNEIRIALSNHGICIRLNTGNFKTEDGRYVKCGFTGLSDLLFLSRNGKAYFIEVKTKKGRPSPEQINFIKTVKEMGFGAGIARSVDDALEIINADKFTTKQ